MIFAHLRHVPHIHAEIIGALVLVAIVVAVVAHRIARRRDK